MPFPRKLTPSMDGCQLAQEWKIDPELAKRLLTMAALFPLELKIISGWRSREQQAQLEAAGRPAAPFELSTHTSCPWATGADLQVVGTVTPDVKLAFGRAAAGAGLRWGGGSPTDASGFPSDWNHVDLGPRT